MRQVPRPLARWAAALVVGTFTTVLDAAEPPVPELVRAVRFAPRSRAAALAVERLARCGPAGWKALATIALNPEYGIARAAARALVGGREPARLELAWKTYLRAKAEHVRADLALGLAQAYPKHESALLARLREGRPGAPELLTALAERGLPSGEIVRCLGVEATAEAACNALRIRGEPPDPAQMETLGRVVARRGLAPAECLAFAARFAAAPDFTLLEVVALRLAADESEAVRVGAHCLLCQVSGIDQPADRDLWCSWIAAAKDRYQAPPAFTPGCVAAAVARAVHYLRQDLLDDGLAIWPGWEPDAARVGSTALAVLALRAARVPPNDPAIRKAIETTLLRFDRGGRPSLPRLPDGKQTYSLGLLAMALKATDADVYRRPLQAIADQLVFGQLENGQWTYCSSMAHVAGRQKVGDNSNTQYALLGLRAARLAGAKIPAECWRRALRHWHTFTHPEGGWGYEASVKHRYASMTAGGLSSLAICHEALAGSGAMDQILLDKVVWRALRYLGTELTQKGLGPLEPYACYGVERACVLTGTKRFRVGEETFDWYERGAKRLMPTQSARGTWGARHGGGAKGNGYGEMVDTCFALLFLGRTTTPVGAAAGTGDVVIELPKGKAMAPALKLATPTAAPSPPVRRRLFRLDAELLATRDGEVVISGQVERGARLTVDGRQVEPDADGRFAVPLTVTAARRIEVVATGAKGEQRSAVVRIELDTTPPELRLAGDKVRHVGKQAVRFEGNELLDYVRVDRRAFPAEGRHAEATVEVREGKRALQVTAVDLAGNASPHSFRLEATNRVLRVDGKSLIWTPLPVKPGRFTLECWVRGQKPTVDRCVTSFAWNWAGAGIFWHAVGDGNLPQTRLPHTLILLDGRYRALAATRAWEWSRWTHLAICYDGRTARFFVNGRLQAEYASESYKNNPDHFHVGGAPGPMWYFVGEIDEVRLSSVPRYDRHFKPPKYHCRDPETVVLLHFDTDTEQTYFDDSGRGRRWNVVGNPALAEVRR